MNFESFVSNLKNEDSHTDEKYKYISILLYYIYIEFCLKTLQISYIHFVKKVALVKYKKLLKFS